MIADFRHNIDRLVSYMVKMFGLWSLGMAFDHKLKFGLNTECFATRGHQGIYLLRKLNS